MEVLNIIKYVKSCDKSYNGIYHDIGLSLYRN